MDRYSHAPGQVGLCFLVCLLLSGAARAAGVPDADFSWCAEARDAPPDYEGYFPDSTQGAAALAAVWASPDRDEIEPSRLLAMVRQGLRRYEGDRADLLRWLGRRFVEGQSSPDAAAVEIMYHVLDSDPEGNGMGEAQSAAIRFGVSLVRPLPPNLLRALASFSISSEDGDDLGRIVWAITDQRVEALAMLEDYARHADRVDLEKVAVVRKLWNREIKANDWVRDLRLARARESFGDKLPGLMTQLASGASDGRRQALEFILRNDVLPILPESALASLSRCASDPDPGVRALVARLVGERWVLAATHLHPRAVDILLALSRDDAALVSHNAVYYGLSVMSPKDEEIIIRLLEVAAMQVDTPLYERILWGLRSCQPRVKTLLATWRASGRPDKVALLEQLERDLTR